MIRASLTAFALTLFAATAASAQDAPVLDTSSYWRTHYTIMQPIYLKAGVQTKMPINTFGCKNAWMQFSTALPPKDWAAADYSDAGWLRLAGLMVASTTKDADTKSPLFGLECLRGKFTVADPAAATGLKLTVEYRGGIVAWINGKELARAHLAKGSDLETLAEPTQADEKFPRRLVDVAIPPSLLRKGVNVLALECHRAPYLDTELVINEKKWPQGITIARASCGVESVRLTAPASALQAVTANASRPAGFQVWNSNSAAADFDMDYGDPNEPLRPIEIVGARNGTFSGKVVVGSTEPIKGLKATATDLVSADGKSRIPASRVVVRYAMPDGIEACAEARYLGSWGAKVAIDSEYPRAYKNAAVTPPEVLENLLDSPPPDVPVWKKSRKDPGQPAGSPVFGAVCGIWATVTIPADVPAGEYSGTLAISADGRKPVATPLRIKVSAWALPSPDKFRSFIDVIESPESLALAYNVPLWSDRHFQLIEASFRRLKGLGSRVVYLPIICQTNLGNAQSLVQWKKKADGQYECDFTVFDRYLDAVERGQGKPEIVCLYVWDSYFDRVLGGRGDEKWEPGDQKKAIAEMKGHGPDMTVADAAAGDADTREMPSYSSPDSAAAWAPVAEGIMTRLKKRGWADRAMLGLMCDYMPTKECALGVAKIFPNLPWASAAHQWPRPLYGIPITYRANVFAGDGQSYLDPSERRLYGWANPALDVHFLRLLREYYPLTTFRLMEETTVMQGYRGVARLGADFWCVLSNRRGERVGSIAGRYPKSFWNNLNIEVNVLAQGPNGPVATARYEAIREGLQECEARIVVERALRDKDASAKLGKETCAKFQAMLDERSRQIRHGTSTLAANGHYVQWAWAPENWWQAPGVAGHCYYIGSGWESRAYDLFAAAAEVEKKAPASSTK